MFKMNFYIKILTLIGILTHPRKSSCDPCLADWHTCLKNLPNPRTPRTSFNLDTASKTLLSSSWSHMSKCNWSVVMSSISNLNFSFHFGLNVCGCRWHYYMKKIFLWELFDPIYLDRCGPNEFGWNISHGVSLFSPGTIFAFKT